jgi:hypothetical protein
MTRACVQAEQPLMSDSQLELLHVTVWCPGCAQVITAPSDPFVS